MNTNELTQGVSVYEALGWCCKALLFGLVVFAVAVASSCTVTLSPDGAKSFSVDGEQALRAIEILNQK